MNKKQTFLALVLMLVLGTIEGRVLGNFIVSVLDTDIGALILITFCPLVGSCLILINPVAGLYFVWGMLMGLTSFLHIAAAGIIGLIIAICILLAKLLPIVLTRIVKQLRKRPIY